MTTDESSSIPITKTTGERDPFDVLSVEPSFDLDVRQLRNRWMRSLSEVHPDAAGSAATAASVNAAFRVLNDPLARGEALLERYGASKAVIVAFAGEQALRALPPSFLIEMMEYRERADSLDAADAAGKEELRVLAREKRDDALAGIRSSFDVIKHATLNEVRWQVAVRNVLLSMNVVRSFDRMLEQLDREDGAEAP